MLSLPVFGACHRYTPVATSGAQPGSEVRVGLTDAGSLSMASLLGGEVVAVEGTLRVRSADSLHLVMRATVQRNGVEQPWTGESISVPLTNVSDVRTRQFDARRSSVLGVGILGGAILAARLAGIDFVLQGTNRGGTKPAR